MYMVTRLVFDNYQRCPVPLRNLTTSRAYQKECDRFLFFLLILVGLFVLEGMVPLLRLLMVSLCAHSKREVLITMTPRLAPHAPSYGLGSYLQVRSF